MALCLYLGRSCTEAFFMARSASYLTCLPILYVFVLPEVDRFACSLRHVPYCLYMINSMSLSLACSMLDLHDASTLSSMM